MTTIITPRQPAKRPLVWAAGTLAALAIVASAGTWQATHRAAAPSSQSIPQTATSPRSRPVTVAATDAGLTVYLVGSEDQRAVVQAGLDLADTTRVREAHPSALVLDVTTPDGAQLAQIVAADASVVRADGQAGVTLIDLRMPAAPATVAGSTGPLARE